MGIPTEAEAATWWDGLSRRERVRIVRTLFALLDVEHAAAEDSGGAKVAGGVAIAAPRASGEAASVDPSPNGSNSGTLKR